MRHSVLGGGIAASQFDGEDGYAAFLQQVVDSGELDGAAEGITKIVIAKGSRSLSSKQTYVFERYVLDVYVTETCWRCGAPIPWEEMLFAHDWSDGACSWCNKMLSNTD